MNTNSNETNYDMTESALTKSFVQTYADWIKRSPKNLLIMLAITSLAQWVFPPIAYFLVGLTTLSVARNNVREAKDFVKEVCEPATTLVTATHTAVAEISQNAGRLMAQYQDIEAEESLCWKIVLKNAQKHKIGMAACLYTASQSNTIFEFGSEITKMLSMIGLEESIVGGVISQISQPVYEVRQEQASFAELGEMLTRTSWDRKRLLGIAGLVTSFSAISLNGKSPLGNFTKAAADSKALEDWWDKGEEYLNSLGVINTGKWAYLKDISDKVLALEQDTTYFNELFQVTPSHIVRPSNRARYEKWCDQVKILETVCTKNTCPDMRNSKVFQSVQMLTVQRLKWNAVKTQMDQTHGLRPEPVGICIQGPPGLGKSLLWGEIQARVSNELHRRYLLDPVRMASFANAREWTCWNMQVRDEYDQGASGQEFVYCDDGFSAVDNEDHKQWLTFISCQRIGTVQAALDDKGRPFCARLCGVSCNVMPVKSCSIVNIDALWRRFPITIQVSLKPNSAVPTDRDEKDHDFTHLNLKVGKMQDFISANAGGVTINGVNHTAGEAAFQSLTVQEIVNAAVEKMVDREMKYQNEFDANEQIANAQIVQVRNEQPTTNNQHTVISPADVRWEEGDAAVWQRAYQTAPCISATDPRIMVWAQYLRRNDGESFVIYCERNPGYTAYDFILSLGAWNLPEEHREVFHAAGVPFGYASLRIRDERLETDYLYNGQWFEGRVLIACPYIEGSLPFNAWNLPEHREVTREIDSVLRDIPNRNTEVLTLRHMLRSIVIPLQILPVEPFLGWSWVMAWMRYTEGVEPWVHVSTAFRSARDSERTYGSRAISIVSIPGSAIMDLFIEMHRYADVLSNRMYSAFASLLDFFGIPYASTVESLARFVLDVGIRAAMLALLPLICGFAYAIFAWIYRQFSSKVENREQQYAKIHKSGEKKPMRETLRRATRDQQYQWIDVSAPVSVDKTDFYAETAKPCPFCDEEILHADGEVIELDDETIVKPNKKQLPEFLENYVLVAPEHGKTSPLSKPQEGENLLARLEELAECLEIDRYVFEQNWGALSSGTVPHEHAQLHVSPYIVDDAVPAESVNVTVAAKRKVIVQRKPRYLHVIEARGPTDPTKWAEFFKKVTTMIEKQSYVSYMLQGQRVNNTFEICLAFSSALNEGKEQPLVKKNIDIESYAKWLKGEVAEVGKIDPDVLLSRVEQSMDDASVMLCRSIVSNHGGLVIRTNNKFTGYEESLKDLNNNNGPYCACLLNGQEVMFPAHLGNVDEIVKIWKTGLVPINEFRLKISTVKPMYAKIVYKNVERDFALAVMMTSDDVQTYLFKKTGLTNYDVYMSAPANFPQGLEKHIMPFSSAISVLAGVHTIQWLPKLGLVQTGKARWCGSQKVCFTPTGEFQERSWIEVNGLSQAASATSSGDCGGLVCAMAKSVPRKVLGFHVAAAHNVQNSCLLTIELLEEARRSYTRKEEVGSVILSTEAVIDDNCEAGYGDRQISGWPKIDWVENDPFRSFIRVGNPIHAPVGPCVKDVGVLIRESPPSNIHKGLASWHKTPFYGVFPEELVPAPIDPKDSRIEKELPVNRKGVPSLLLGPNTVMAEQLPAPDADILEEVYQQVVSESIAAFSGEPIGYAGSSIDDLIDEAINGKPGNHFMTGMETDASAGLPWTLSTKISKKSDLIATSDEGVRSFTKEGSKLRAQIERKLRMGIEGKRCMSFSVSKLKNTCVKLKHVAIGKTRVFNASSVDDVIMSNAVFGRWKEVYLRKRLECNHAIGINVHSVEWDELYRYLDEFPYATDADFANYDKHLQSIFQRLVARARIDVIEAVSPDHLTNARYVSSETDINTIMVDCDSVYQTEHSNKSGTADTTPQNSEVNKFQLIYVFFKTVKPDLAYFRQNVRFVSFGDDIVITFTPEVADRFNFNVIQEELAKIGHVVTPGLKFEGPVPPFVKLSETTFLKRRFHHLEGFAVAPLEKSSIQQCFNWTETDWGKLDVVYNMIAAQLNEAVLWGSEYYTDFVQKLTTRMNEPTFPYDLRVTLAPLFARSFEIAKNIYLDAYGIRTEQSSETAIGKLIDDTKSTLYRTLDALKIPEASAEWANVNRQLTQLGQKLDTTITELNTVSLEAKTALTDSAKAIAEVQKMNAELSKIESNLDNTTKDVNKLKTDIVNYGKDINQLKLDFDDMKESLAGTILRVEEVSGQVQAMVGDVNHLKGVQSIHAQFFNNLAGAFRNLEGAWKQTGPYHAWCSNYDKVVGNHVVAAANNAAPSAAREAFDNAERVTTEAYTQLAEVLPLYREGAREPGIVYRTLQMGDSMKVTFTDRLWKAQSIPCPTFDEVNDAMSEGALVSEVGFPVNKKTLIGTRPVFNLREPRPGRTPRHVFGKMFMGDALSAHLLWTIPCPAAGTSVFLEGIAPRIQVDLLNYFWYIRGDAVWTIRLDECLGASHLLQVSTPEMDEKTVRRSVRWKTTQLRELTFSVPFSASRAMLRNVPGLTTHGTNGLAIKLECLENNSVETVASPQIITLGFHLTNLKSARWISKAGDVVNLPAALKMSLIPEKAPPVPPTDFVIRYEQMADADTPAALGDSAQSGDQVVQPDVSGEGIDPAPALGSTPVEAKPLPTEAPTKPAVGAMTTKWTPLTKVAISAPGDWITIPIDLKKIQKGEGGDAISGAYRRNLWVAGDSRKGPAQFFAIKLISNKPVQVAGMVEIAVNDVGGPRYFHEIGGAATEFNVFANNFFMDLKDNNERAITTPWLRTNVLTTQFKYRVISLNRVQDFADVKMTVLIKPGAATFQAPIKARKEPASFSPELAAKKLVDTGEFSRDVLLGMITAIRSSGVCRVEQSGEYDIPCDDGCVCDDCGAETACFSTDDGSNAYCQPCIQSHGAGGNGETFDNRFAKSFTPAGVKAQGVAGAITRSLDVEEEFPQDSFWVRLAPIDVGDEKVHAIPMTLPLLMDSMGNDGLNPIAERFSRFATIVPTGRSDFGPAIGEYSLVGHLPTTTTANLMHVCLPGDMNAEAAAYIFGLGSLGSLAATAISSLGGPLISGAINALGGLANSVLPGLGSAVTSVAETVLPQNIGGLIPVDREHNSVQLVPDESGKPVSNPFGNLLLQAIDIIQALTSKATPSVMITPYIRMNRATYERGVYDRSLATMIRGTATLNLTVPLADALDISARLIVSNDQKHHNLAMSIIGQMTRMQIRDGELIDLAVAITAKPIDASEARRALVGFARFGTVFPSGNGTTGPLALERGDKTFPPVVVNQNSSLTPDTVSE